MRIKNSKLQKQFKELKPSARLLSDIFKGVVIFVNGYTNPSSDKLKALMADHGGGYQHYYSLSSCTHIIATNLPNSKILDIKGKLVVHPDWISESVAAGKLLSATKYLLYSKESSDQKTINFSIQSTSTQNSSIGYPLQCDVVEEEDNDQKHCNENDKPTNNSNSLIDLTDDNTIEKDCLYNLDDGLDLEQDWIENDSSNQIDTETDINILQKAQELIQLPSKKHVSPILSNHEYDNKYHTIPSKAIPKALDDNFVSEFYRNSRLHHLSMWKAELRKFTKQIHDKKVIAKTKIKIGDHLYFHIDLDSFFVCATLKKRPELKGLPIAVCHGGQNEGSSSTSKASYAAIASASYEARAFGLRNGMFLGEAKKLCPNLICVPYEFEIYRNVSEKFYCIMTSLTQNIEAVSCDEAYLEVSELLTQGKSAMQIAAELRQKIQEKTECTASVGISSNLLLARMATRVAKPNGQYEVTKDKSKDFIGNQHAKDLPGVGWVLAKKLKSMNIETCKQLQTFSLAKLQLEFGPKTGSSLFKYCRGEDERTLIADRKRKSVSADINYGIRFTEQNEPRQFILNLASEVSRRLVALGLKGSAITIKIMVRKDEAPASTKKYMGHGICYNVARSTNIKPATNSAEKIGNACVKLVESMDLAPDVYRGIGIQVTKIIDETDITDEGVSLLKFTKPIDPSVTFQHKVPDASPRKVSASPHKGKRQSPGNRKTSGKRKANNERRISNFVVKRGPDDVSILSNIHNSSDPPLPSLSLSPAKSRTSSISLDLPSATSIDPSVFYALPKEMQASIKASYAAKDEIFNISGSQKQTEENTEKNNVTTSVNISSKNNSISNAVCYDDIDQEVWKELPSQIQKELLEERDARITDKPEKASSSKSTGLFVSEISKPGPSMLHRPVNLTTPSLEKSKSVSTTSRLPEFNTILSPSQIDQDVLKQLPPELRHEVEMSAAITRNRQNKKIDQKCEKRLLTEMISEKSCCTNRNQRTLESHWLPNKGRPDLGGSVTFDDVKRQLKAWISSGEGPCSEDIDMACSYFLALYNDHNLEQLHNLLKVFRRNASEHGMEWNKCFNVCLEFVQRFLKDKMNATLPVAQL